MSGLRPPTDAQMRRALVDAATCLRRAASNWRDIPGRERLRLLRCAERAERVVGRMVSAATGRRGA